MTKEERKAKNKAYYEAHKEELKAYAKAYRKANNEEIKVKDKARYESHKEERKAKSKVYSRTKGRCAYLNPKYDWSQVEGYDGWKEHTDVHHRWEDLGYSQKRLIAMDHYYNCEPWELICLTPSEHQHKPKVFNRRK